MANKKLYQVDWSGGQTDGDQTNSTVKKLLNVEIDEFGKMRPRGRLSRLASGLPRGNSAYMPANPAEYYDADGWLGFVTPTGVALFMQNDGEITTTSVFLPCGISNIDPLKSEISVYGDKFFLAAVDSSDTPLGVYMAMAPSSTNRFPASYGIAGSSRWDGSSETSELKWFIEKVQYPAPILSVENLVGIIPDLNTPPNRFASNFDKRVLLNDLMDRLTASMVPNGNLGVGIVSFFSHVDNDLFWNGGFRYTDGLYGVYPEISLRVQFVLFNGQLSEMSAPITVKPEVEIPESLDDDDHDANNGYSFGFTVVLPDSLSGIVKGVNVYRKTLEPGGTTGQANEDYFLLFTSWVDGDSSVLFEERMGTTRLVTTPRGDSGAQALIGGSRDGTKLYSPFFEPTTPGPFSSPLTGSPSAPTGRHYVHLDGTFYRTTGWAKINSNFRIFLHQHFAVKNGRMYMRVWNYIASAFLIRSVWGYFRGNFMSTRFGLSTELKNTMIRCGSSLPRVRVRNGIPTVGVLLGKPGPDMWYGPGFHSYGTHIPPDSISATDVTIESHGVEESHPENSFTTESDQVSVNDVPLVMFKDRGEVTLDTEASYNGFVSEQSVSNKPRHIAITGGRLVGLNGIHDGDDRKSRAWYSQYQKYGMFHKNSMIDYGARDDGVGLGLSVHKGKLVFHFSSATYIIDVSGGTDMSWRELGAYKNIGLVNQYAKCESEYGVFWGDRNDVYWFNGKALENVSHFDRANRTVRATYRAMVKDNPDGMRFSYRHDMRQLFVSSGADILVLDIDKMAWHVHDIELEIGRGDITNTFNIDGVEMVVIDTGTSSYIYKFDETIYTNFVWGLEFSYDGGAAEIVKKSKRFYIDLTDDHDLGSLTFKVIVTGDSGNSSSMWFSHSDGMLRFSSSMKGRKILFDLKSLDTRSWRGTIESIGMSHKVKPVK